MPDVAIVKHIEPTFLSSELITPGKRHRGTLPSIGKQNAGNTSGRLWGNEADYKRQSSLKAFQIPKLIRDPTHKHFGTKTIQMRSETQPYALTQLKLSDCRKNDERPMEKRPFENEVIWDPVSRLSKRTIQPKKCLRDVNPFFSHTSKFDVFPPTERFADTQESCRNFQDKDVSNLLSKRTMEALRSYRTSLCWTTTYMNTYKDPHGEKRANARKRTKTNVNSSQVNRPANETKSSRDHDIAKERTRRSSDVACVKKPRICGYCYKRKGKISGIKIENENRKMDCSTLPKEIRGNVLPSKNEEMQKRVTWPVAQKDMRGSKPTNTDITIGGYNDRLKCPVLSSPFCKCDVKSQALKESMLKANALARRRAASFDKRNFTTISVFHLLKHDPVAAQRQLFHKDRTSDTFMKKPYCSDWNIDYRSDAVRQFYEKFPEGTPVLNNYSKT